MGASALPLLRPFPPPSSGHLYSRRNTYTPCFPSYVAMRHGIGRRGAVFPILAGGEGDGLSKEEAARPNGEEPAMGPEESGGSSAAPGGGGGQEPPPRRRAASSAGIRWRELLLDPDPDNVLAVGLTGLLAWASVQVLWQLFFISLSILLAALKYSFIAALLLFILITLL